MITSEQVELIAVETSARRFDIVSGAALALERRSVLGGRLIRRS